MFVTFRSVLTVIAALTASSVAPAKVAPQMEPLTTVETTKVPLTYASLPIPARPTETLLTPPASTEGESEPATDTAEEEALAAKASLAETVASLRSTEAGSRELECLAGAIYFESKSESLKGQLAVGHVIANRTTSGKYPKSFCGVVYQRGQFSFVRGGSMPSIARGGLQWRNAVAVAKIVANKLHDSPVGKALSFHARRVSPGWRMTRVATLGNHVFYR